MPRTVPLLLLSLLLTCACTAPAAAAWPSDPDVNVTLCTAAGTQQSPNICSDGAGGAIIVWMDFRSGTADVYARRVDRSGTPLWTVDGVAVCTATGAQGWPVVCSDHSGGAIVAWQDNRSGNYDIYVQRISASGTMLWAANGVALCTAAEAQSNPVICSDGGGGAVVAWEDSRIVGDDNIYVRHVDYTGTPQWTTNGVAMCTATGEQYSIRIVEAGAGGAILVWNDSRSGNWDIYARRVSSTGSAQWAANGVAVCDAALAQWNPVMVSDGASGAIVAWGDTRSGEGDIYAQRVNVSGVMEWADDGVAVCAATGVQEYPSIASDEAGGAIVAWTDSRGTDMSIYSQRVRATGLPQWTANGVSLCTYTGDQAGTLTVSDGAGGAIVGWYDMRAGASVVQLYARRVSASGVAQWASNGVAMCTTPGGRAGIGLVSDGEGGAIMALTDPRGSTSYDVYAQRVDRFGALGNAEPTITEIQDVSSDQGGQVVVEWTASYLDADPTFYVENYSVWRQVPASLATAQLAAFAISGAPADESPGAGRPALRATALGAQTLYWEYVGSQPARGREGYSFVAATTTDSMAGSNPLTRFMVSAEAAGGTPYWDSAPDSGYSVDDLPPPTPQPFTGQFVNGTTALQWGVSAAPDFAAFRLYRGLETTFVPGAANLVATLTTGGFADAAGTPFNYKVCAVDVHGNASPFALALLGGVADVPGAGLPREAWLAAPSPNPAHAGAVVRFGLPREARVALLLFDAQGRRVRTLLAGTAPAGEHSQRWDGTDAAGRPLAAGLYLCRLEVDGRVLTRRLAVVR